MTLFSKIISFIFPDHCVSCKTPGTLLCSLCRKILESPNPLPVPYMHSVTRYQNKVTRKLLWQLKYNGKFPLAIVIAQMMYDQLLDLLSDEALFSNFERPLLVAIPISRKRKRERGFNQSELIAKALFQIDKGVSLSYLPRVLIKIKETKQQALIKNKTERFKNAHNTFSLERKNEISGRNIIVIDDIITTGATMEEARRVLKKAGAKSVLCFSFAH